MTAEATSRVAAPDPSGEPPRTLGGRVIDLLIDSRPVLLAVMIIGLATWMAISHGTRFINEANLSSVLLDAAQAGILTIGMTILMIGVPSTCPSVLC